MKLTGVFVGSAIIGFNLLTSSEAFALSNSDTGALGNALDFNAFIFNDLTATGGDTEGRLAVGGNVTFNGSYSVGECSSNSSVSQPCRVVTDTSGNPVSTPNNRVAGGSQFQSNGGRDDLVVGGNIISNASGGTSFNLLAGNGQVGGSVTNVTISALQGNQLFTNRGANNVGIDFAAQEQGLKDNSTRLSQFAQTGNIVRDTSNFLTLSGDHQGLNVFNVTDDQWGGNKTRTIDVPDGSKVLINVSGEIVELAGAFDFGADDCQFTSPNSCEEPLDFSPNTLINYFEATQIDMTTFQHEGAFLAPLATFNVSGGAINGQAILDTVIAEQGFEFHFRENNGTSFNQEAIPFDVNHSSALVAAGVFFGGLKLRKLRQQREKLEE